MGDCYYPSKPYVTWFKSRTLKCFLPSVPPLCLAHFLPLWSAFYVTSYQCLTAWGLFSSIQLPAPWGKDWMLPSTNNTCEGKACAVKNLSAFIDWIPLILSILGSSGSDQTRRLRRNSGSLSCGKVFLRGHLWPYWIEDITKLLKWQRGWARHGFFRCTGK